MHKYFAAILIFLAACSTPQEPVVTPLPTPEVEVTLGAQAVTTALYPVLTSSDDAEQQGSTVFTTHQELEMVFERNVNQVVGYRFTGLDNIPQNATVTDVRLRFTAAVSNSTAASLRIYTQAGNPGTNGTFATAANNLTNRTLSPTSVPWTPSAWVTGTRYETPNLVTTFNEGRNSVGEVVFIVKGTGLRQAASTDSSYANGARLRVVYSVPDAPPPTNYSTPAKFTAQQLHDSFGLNIHEGYDNTFYGQTALLNAEIRNIDPGWVRIGLYDDTRAFQPGFIRDLQAEGYKFSLGVGEPVGQTWAFTIGESDKLIQDLTSGDYAGVRLDRFEMPNEPDCFGGSNWLVNYNTFYDEYYGALKQAYPNVLITGPSFCTASGPSQTTRHGDVANIHPYSGAQRQEHPDIAAQIANAKNRVSGRGVVATEWGFHNALNCTNCQPPITEALEPHYMVRGIVWMFAQGVEQSFDYQLFDYDPGDTNAQEQENQWGLIAPQGNPAQPLTTWTPRYKPAYYAVQRQQIYTDDSGTGVAPANLPFVCTNPSNAFVYGISRKDGSYDIVTWLDNELWNRYNETPVADTSSTITCNFNTVSDVDSYRPSVSGTVTDLGVDSTSITATIDGKVTYLRVRPQ